MDHRTELSDAISQIINSLSAIQIANQENPYTLQTCALRLEVLAETSLTTVDIPLEVVDLLNCARTYIKNVCDPSTSGFISYEAPLNRNGERGRPKFVISEEQLVFFKGNVYGKYYTDRENKPVADSTKYWVGKICSST
jgi:hypothetical protein